MYVIFGTLLCTKKFVQLTKKTNFSPTTLNHRLSRIE